MRKSRSYFKNKKCLICKKQATTYRLTRNSFYYICDRKRCSRKVLIKAGILEGINIKRRD